MDQILHLGSFTGATRDLINSNFSMLEAMNAGVYKGGASWFVDGTLGYAGNPGTFAKPFATIQSAVTAANAYDTIFIKPKKITDFSGDPTSYAETIIIPANKPHLSLVGLGGGPNQGNQPQIKKGSGSTALITIRAAGCTIANLGINGGSSTGGGILLDDDYSAKTAFGTVIVGCHFKNCVGSTATDCRTGGAIMWPAAGNAWQVSIIGNTFYKCVGGVVLMGTSNTAPQDVLIQGNRFMGTAATVDCYLYLAGGSGMASVVVDSNLFASVLPALGSGSIVRYVDMTGCTGLFSNNIVAGVYTTAGFGAAKAAGKLPATVGIAHNYSDSGLIVREA
jgi:hypothetical protein